MVSPCPGKCFTQGRIPDLTKPLTRAEESFETNSGSLPKERSPITVFLSLVKTSTQGEKFKLIPTAKSSRPMVSANLKPKAAEPISPKRLIGGHCVKGALRRATRPPSISILTKSCLVSALLAVRLCSSFVRSPSWAGDSTFRSKRITPPTLLVVINFLTSLLGSRS